MIRESTLARRISNAWRDTTRDERALGRKWYADARKECREIAHASGLTLRACAGILAALSPRVHWHVNVRLARMVAAGDNAPSGAMRDPLGKAIAIRDGARPLDVLRGDKVRAFYRAIVGGTIARAAFVLDVWMIRTLGLAREATAVPSRVYALATRAAVEVSRRARVAVTALQASLWIRERGRAS